MKTSAAPKKFPKLFVSRAQMIELSRLGLKWGFNRQIADSIAEIPSGRYPVEFMMLHHHKQFRPCREHVRIRIGLRGRGCVSVDVTKRHFRKLFAA